MQTSDNNSNNRVAIIGAGPGGLVTAKYLAARGFDPVIFERRAGVGGQWDASADDSPVWRSMVANTSRELTCFSDLEYPDATPVFPGNRDVLAYLHRYARTFELLDRVRLRTRVLSVAREPVGFRVSSQGEDGARRSEHFDKVVVASGRYHAPSIPEVPGLAALLRDGRAFHSSAYRGPDAFRGKRVLVLGSSISAVEIASELAAGGARTVLSSCRRQRYVLQKMMAGVPADQLAFTRFAALAGESFPPEIAAHGLKELIVRHCGSPEQYGAPKPHENVFAAGITQSQHYLALVAEGRILPKPVPQRFEGTTARFSDSDAMALDAVIVATGFKLDLPFFDDSLRQVLGADERGMDLYQFTFHPAVPDLAFVGMFCLVGPHLPVLELQARWIAYAWSGALPMRSAEEMEQGRAMMRERDRAPEVPMPEAALRFAREAGVEPDLSAQPELLSTLAFGPLTPVSFRISGPDCVPDAASRTRAAAHRAVHSPALTPEQHGMLQALAGARQDAHLARAASVAAGLGAPVEPPRAAEAS